VYLDRLEISYFRNLSSASLDLNPGLNFFYGPNGAGKTAVLEAAHLLGRGRSFRTHRARTLIQHDSESLAVRATINDDHGAAQSVAISKDLAGHTELRINGLPERRVSEIARLVPLQVMLPDIGELVFGGPQVRRQWLDWGTFHVKPEYLRSLRGYLRALKQRNAALKQVGHPAASIAPWTEQLVSAAREVDQQRTAYVEALQPEFTHTVGRLAPELEVRLNYRRGWPEGESLDKVLGEWGPREVKSGLTQVGPHRADIDLRIGNSKASAVLSRGQGKAVASALKVSQARLLANSDRRGSVFLIDDVGAELDESHNARFFEMLDEMGSQILATSTRRPSSENQFSDDRINVFHVERGTVHRSANG
jgi:DNA replication and repair protein RecF